MMKNCISHDVVKFEVPGPLGKKVLFMTFGIFGVFSS